MAREKLTMDAPERHGACMAYGCPNAGSMSHSTVGPTRDWVCRFHFFADALAWPEVTRKLRVEGLLPDAADGVNF